ncbi:MAG: TRAP transporter fused permease subunit [Pseudomonadota bacterium]
MRNLRGYYRWIAGSWVLFAALFHLYTGAFGVLEPRLQRAVHLMFLLPAAFLYCPANKKSPKDRFTWLDLTLALLSIAPFLLLILEIDRLNTRFEYVTELIPRELFLGALAVILLLEGIRRAVVPAMAVLGCLVIIYMMTCQYFPSILYNRPFEISRIVENLYLLTDNGMVGSITGISATYAALFVLFGAFISGSGTGEFFTNLACKLAGGSRGGPAKIAVVSSGFFGAISGVAAANVYTTGTFSIPLMKRLGYRPRFAAAVEASASTGGMILPPVMGAGAFVMSEITGVPYVKICYAAAIGAVMYFISIGLMVHLEAVKLNLKSMSKEEMPLLKQVVKDSYLLLPVLALVWFLVVGYSPFMAVFIAILFSLGITLGKMVVKEVRYAYGIWLNPERLEKGHYSKAKKIFGHFIKEIYGTGVNLKDSLIMAGRNMIMLALACAGAGLLISVIANTGLGLVFSSVVVAYSKGIIFFALLFVMASSIILGMGLPATAAYVIAVSVGGPALIKLGGELLAVHLFVYYFAILAAVTPPVCIAAYAGASLAGTDPLRTGLEASRLAFAGFLVPYMFYFDHALLMRGSFVEVSLSAISMLVCILLITSALEGWFLKTIPIAVRGIMLAAGISLPFLFSNKLYAVIIGLVILIILFFFQSWIISEGNEGAIAEGSET